MNTVTISNEYQIVIPKEIGDAIGAKPGTRLEVLSYDEKIVLVPIRPMRSMKGAFKGINTEIERTKGSATPWKFTSLRSAHRTGSAVP